MHILKNFILATLLLTAGCTKEYTATATIQLEEEDDSYVDREFDGRPPPKAFSMAVAVISSSLILERVTHQLDIDGTLEALTKPYKAVTAPEEIASILIEKREFQPDEKNHFIHISFSHPDPEIAAIVANTFANVYLDYERHLEMENAMQGIEDLRIRADQQKQQVEELELKLAKAREANETGEAYDALQRELDVQHGFLQAMVSQMTKEKACGFSLRVRYPELKRAVTPKK